MKKLEINIQEGNRSKDSALKRVFFFYFAITKIWVLNVSVCHWWPFSIEMRCQDVVECAVVWNEKAVWAWHPGFECFQCSVYKTMGCG